MKILGLIEVHPFDGTEGFVCLRIDNNGNMFDLPIDREQLDIIVTNTQGTPTEQDDQEYEDEEEEVFTREQEEYTPSPIKRPVSDENTLYINAHPQQQDYAEYAMGESLWDDDL